MNDIRNNIKHRSASPSSSPHQANGTLAPVTDTPDSLNVQSPPKPRIYCLNTRRIPNYRARLIIEHRASRPSAAQDLVALYSLTPLANAVARFDPVTGKKNTMRKSYQGHIKDLPGKNIIKPDSVIREIIRVPDSEADTFVGPRNIRRLERDTLEGFGVMPGVIPDFDPSLLGLDDDLSEYDQNHHRDGRDGDESDTYNSNRRKKKRRSEDTDLDALSGADERKKKRKKNVLTPSPLRSKDHGTDV